MTFTETIKLILEKANKSLTPQEIRKIIKIEYPEYFGTNSHVSNVSQGHYKDFDHALLAQIYTVIRANKLIFCDNSVKPMKAFLKGKNVKKLIQFNSHFCTPVTNNEIELIDSFAYYYTKSLTILKDFGGPSIYFHVQAIREQENNFLSNRHIEMIYGTLASWGMHKMGDPTKTKAKMVDFIDFKNSIIIHKDDFKKLRNYRIDACTVDEYNKYINELEKAYFNLKVSISNATIVANSKVLAHILPNLIPPIDRQYTIRFFTQDNKEFFTKTGYYKQVNIPKNSKEQFSDFRSYCCKIKRMFDYSNHKVLSIDKETFNTSYPKIMDNLIVAFIKSIPKPNK